MLLSLQIRNIALIESLSLEFSLGLHVLTGETGAGKSILVDALSLVLGGRADKELLKSGSEKGGATALFEPEEDSPVHVLLDELGIELEEGQLLLGRELTAAGRTTCRVQGQMVPLTTLRQVAALLVDLSGQQESQALLDSKHHQKALDDMGDATHLQYLLDVQRLFSLRQDVKRRIAAIAGDEGQRERQMDMLSYQINEIEEARIKVGEEETLQMQRSRFRNAQKIEQALTQSYALLYDGQDEIPSSLDALKEAVSLMESVADCGPEFAVIAEKLNDVFYQLEDVVYSLRDLRDEQEFDPKLAQRVEARLDKINRLCKKYGETTAEVVLFCQNAQEELSTLAGSEKALVDLKKELVIRENELKAACDILHKSRVALAKVFEKNMLAQLSELGMGKTQFCVALVQKEEMSAGGQDEVSFLLSPNPGQPLKALSRIASGGELSRIMLALKNIGANSLGVQTMIFDEIDTGISGRMAQVVAEKLAAISRSKQVFCVTHLPQLAAMGDIHYLVEKSQEINSTKTTVKMLSMQERTIEVARMVGGADGGDTAILHAQNMIDAANRIKNA